MLIGIRLKPGYGKGQVTSGNLCVTRSKIKSTDLVGIASAFKIVTKLVCYGLENFRQTANDQFETADPNTTGDITFQADPNGLTGTGVGTRIKDGPDIILGIFLRGVVADDEIR